MVFGLRLAQTPREAFYFLVFDCVRGLEGSAVDFYNLTVVADVGGIDADRRPAAEMGSPFHYQ